MLKNAGIIFIALVLAAFVFVDEPSIYRKKSSDSIDTTFKDSVEVDTWRNNGIYYAKSVNLTNVPLKVKICYVTDQGQYRSKEHYLIRPGGSATFHSNYGINHVSAVFHVFTDPRPLECPFE